MTCFDGDGHLFATKHINVRVGQGKTCGNTCLKGGCNRDTGIPEFSVQTLLYDPYKFSTST